MVVCPEAALSFADGHFYYRRIKHRQRNKRRLTLEMLFAKVGMTDEVFFMTI
jgi:hypothetical protein